MASFQVGNTRGECVGAAYCSVWGSSRHWRALHRCTRRPTQRRARRRGKHVSRRFKTASADRRAAFASSTRPPVRKAHSVSRSTPSSSSFSDFFVPTDEAHHFAGNLSLSITPTEYLEVFAAAEVTSAWDDSNDPLLIQRVADLLLGLKGFYQAKPWVAVGGDASIAFLGGVGDAQGDLPRDELWFSRQRDPGLSAVTSAARSRSWRASMHSTGSTTRRSSQRGSKTAGTTHSEGLCPVRWRPVIC